MFRHKSDSITKGFLNECPTELGSIFSTIKPYPKHALFQFIRSLPTLKLIFEATESTQVKVQLEKTTIEADIRCIDATKAELQVSYQSIRLGHRLVIHIHNANKHNQAVTPFGYVLVTCCTESPTVNTPMRAEG